MQVNKVQNTNFKAVKYTSNSAIYVSRFLTTNDKNLLKKGEQRLRNTRYWDLEVTGAGLRVASKHTKDAFLDEFYANYPKSPNLKITSLYDGHAEPCKTGEKCEFDLNYNSTGYAMLAYENFNRLPLVERAITIVEKLEEQFQNKVVSPDSSIARRENIILRILGRIL